MNNQIIARGSFTSDGTAKQIALRSDFDRFETLNRTQAATQQSTGRAVEHKWAKGLTAGQGYKYSKTNSTDALNLLLTTGGFTRVDQSSQVLGAAQATSGTDITAADPAVVTVTGHGLVTGDRVRVYGTTGMLQIAGYDFTVEFVDANSFQLPYLDASGFAAVATAGFIRKVPNNPIFAPQHNRVLGITAASSAVVTLAVTHGLVVGQKIRLYVSSDYGMLEANALLGEITAISTANNTVTLDIDSSAFTAFAFPTSAVAALGVSPAHIVPVGEIPSVLDGAMENSAQIVMELAAGAQSPAGSSADVIDWVAYAAGYALDE